MKAIDILVKRIIEEIENGTLPWRRPWKSWGCKNVSGREYNGFNRLLLSTLPYKYPYYLTFKQVKNAGGHVKSGEKGYPVLFYNWQEFETIEDDGTVIRQSIPFIRYYTVFNVEQCTNLPDSFYNIDKPTNVSQIPMAQGVIDNMPNPPTIQVGGNEAVYNPVTDTITVPSIHQYDIAEQYYCSVFHELGHATGHPSRLNRKLKGRKDLRSYSREELVGELTAAFLGNYCNFPEDAYLKPSASYLKYWIDTLRANPKVLIQASSQAEKAYKYILGQDVN